MADVIRIVSAANDNYAPHLGAMLHSVFSSSPQVALEFYFAHRPALSPQTIDRLQALCQRHGASFTAVPVPDAWLADYPATGRYTVEAWYRAVLPRLLPALDRLLWLDADLIVLRSVEALWNADMEGKPVAAVPHALISTQWELPQALGMTLPRSTYFGTGVMLMDLEQMRRTMAVEKLRAAAIRLKDRIVYADQDAFNAVFCGNYKALPLTWNVATGTYFDIDETVRVHGPEQFHAALRDPGIVHFTRLKPWLFKDSHPHAHLYLHHRAAAGWPPPDYPRSSIKEGLLRQIPFTARIAARALLRSNLRALAYLLRATTSRRTDK